MLQTARAERIVNGVPTEALLQCFADRILVLVTQLGKVGNLIQATIPPTVPLLPAPPPDPSNLNPSHRPLPPPPPSIELTPLLGNAPSPETQPLYSLYASQIATIIWTAESDGLLGSSRRGVIVGIALKRRTGTPGESANADDTETFLSVMDMVFELLEQN
ncbi:hypothetical protein EW146_g627 [Bondarzewia mesenterica]|uniref:Proteasome assembly chaperone 3 n=1 Tax=Bondarzewia mesenterica TaxID=1095465 RepID=A0A4S4M6S1_9AGAM|nr:hypothetical protein EW146_g627 [Bondarzewia mesenterica]